MAHWNADAFDNDQWAQLTRPTANFAEMGPCVRVHATAHTGYELKYDNGNKYMTRRVAGSGTTLASYNSGGVSTDDVMRFEVVGTTLTPKLNGVVDSDLGAQTDSSIASGSGGLFGYADSTGATGDDWSAGNMAAGGLSIPVAFYHYMHNAG